MNDLGHIFTVMYFINLETLELVIGEAHRILAERQRHPEREVPARWCSEEFPRAR
jgi:hypothetical protein